MRIKLYDRADIYDLIENEDCVHIVRDDWKDLLAGRKVETLLDVSIGAGAMTLAGAGIRGYGFRL